MPMIQTAYEANNLVLIGARVPQIVKAFRERSTGQLSIITFGMNLAGSVARIFTATQEGGGAAMVRAYILSEC
jgi:mannose-P-dolichol utilization defect protein 1